MVLTETARSALCFNSSRMDGPVRVPSAPKDSEKDEFLQVTKLGP